MWYTSSVACHLLELSFGRSELPWLLEGFKYFNLDGTLAFGAVAGFFTLVVKSRALDFEGTSCTRRRMVPNALELSQSFIVENLGRNPGTNFPEAWFWVKVLFFSKISGQEGAALSSSRPSISGCDVSILYLTFSTFGCFLSLTTYFFRRHIYLLLTTLSSKRRQKILFSYTSSSTSLHKQ